MEAIRKRFGDCPDSAEGTTSVFARSVLDLAERRGGTPQYDPVTAEWITLSNILPDSSTKMINCQRSDCRRIRE